MVPGIVDADQVLAAATALQQTALRSKAGSEADVWRQVRVGCMRARFGRMQVWVMT